MDKKLNDIICSMQNKLLSSSLVSMKAKDEDDFDMMFDTLPIPEEVRNNLHLTTEEEKSLIRSVFKKSMFLPNATTYEDNVGNIYVNDGGLLCGVIYKIDCDKNITIYGRK